MPDPIPRPWGYLRDERRYVREGSASWEDGPMPDPETLSADWFSGFAERVKDRCWNSVDRGGAEHVAWEDGEPALTLRAAAAHALVWAAAFVDKHPEASDWDAAVRGLLAKAREAEALIRSSEDSPSSEFCMVIETNDDALVHSPAGPFNARVVKMRNAVVDEVAPDRFMVRACLRDPDRASLPSHLRTLVKCNECGYAQPEATYGTLARLECHAPSCAHHHSRKVKPTPKRHTFGGVVFEETGEVREAREGEWYMAKSSPPGPVFCSGRQDWIGGVRTILRPVGPESPP